MLPLAFFPGTTAVLLLNLFFRLTSGVIFVYLCVLREGWCHCGRIAVLDVESGKSAGAEFIGACRRLFVPMNNPPGLSRWLVGLKS